MGASGEEGSSAPRFAAKMKGSVSGAPQRSVILCLTSHGMALKWVR